MNDVLWRGREVWRGDVTFRSEHVGAPTHTTPGRVTMSLYGDRGVDTHKWEPTGWVQVFGEERDAIMLACVEASDEATKLAEMLPLADWITESVSNTWRHRWSNGNLAEFIFQISEEQWCWEVYSRGPERWCLFGIAPSLERAKHTSETALRCFSVIEFNLKKWNEKPYVY